MGRPYKSREFLQIKSAKHGRVNNVDFNRRHRKWRRRLFLPDRKSCVYVCSGMVGSGSDRQYKSRPKLDQALQAPILRPHAHARVCLEHIFGPSFEHKLLRQLDLFRFQDFSQHGE